MRLTLAAATALALAGCFARVADRCATCAVVSRFTAVPRPPATARTVYLVVPGILGYGPEWDAPLELLRHSDGAATMVFEWSPWSSIDRVADDLARIVDQLVALPKVTEVVVIAHSAGGLFAAHAAARFVVPEGRSVRVVTVSAPYAGMEVLPLGEGDDFLDSPTLFAIGGTFQRYPAPAPRVAVATWLTAWPPDDVMKRRFGHDPADPRVGPPGPRTRLPAGTSHDDAVLMVVRRLLGK